MKVNKYKTIKKNSGELIKTDELINIKSGRWISYHIQKYPKETITEPTSHPMEFNRNYCFDKKRVYFLYFLGNRNSDLSGTHISLNWIQNQRFLFLQKSHWLQKENNIRYIINILFLIGGLVLSYLNLC